MTRDTHYIGPKYSLTCSCPDGGTGATTSTGSSGALTSFFTDYRGKIANIDMHTKGIALGYGRFIPLHDGFYEISVSMRGLSGTQLGLSVQVNETDVRQHWAYTNNNDHGGMNFSDTYYMIRGQSWNVKVVSGTFRDAYKFPNLFQVKYLGNK